jgi:tetratricopeptide (TPR) repeat protein
MKSDRASLLTLIALLVLCFGLAAHLDIWFQTWEGSRTGSTDVLSVLLGDARKIFARQFFVKADAYFHSGYYPSIFDNNEAFQTPHMAEDAGAMAGHNQGEEAGFLGKPRDWIDALSRQLFPSVHTHLDEGGAQALGGKPADLGGSSEVGEILPWLKLSAALDPDSVQTYTTTAYWLRERMGKVDEAEQFLRVGLRHIPNSYEILYELGRVYAENRKDPQHAINLWEAALRNWQKQEPSKKEPDRFMFIQITSHLALIEEQLGNYEKALNYMEMWKAMSYAPAEVQQRIDGVKKKLAERSTPRP